MAVAIAPKTCTSMAKARTLGENPVSGCPSERVLHEERRTWHRATISNPVTAERLRTYRASEARRELREGED